GGRGGARGRRPRTAEDPVHLAGHGHPGRQGPGQQRAGRRQPVDQVTPKEHQMKKHAFVIALALALPFSAAAHKQWLVPSQATVNGQDVWVTFDAAVSNQLFFPDHVPMRLDNVVATAPDGSQVRLQNASTGKYRSTFDLQLQQEGTYRIANINRGVSAR